MINFHEAKKRIGGAEIALLRVGGICEGAHLRDGGRAPLASQKV